MFEKLKDIERRYEALEKKLGDPSVVSNRGEYQRCAKEHADLRELVETFREYERAKAQLEECQRILRENDEELKEIAREELPLLREKVSDLEGRLKILLIPRDPNDEKNVILEIRAGTGGDEAGLFAADLYRMYARYAESMNWKVDVLSSSAAGGMGGFKEIILLVEGKGA